MTILTLVTGANGHLGNNIIRTLLDKGRKVRAMVRNPKNVQPFQDLEVEIVYGDLLKPDTLKKALENVDIIYHAAAPFKFASLNPEQEIISDNLQGVRNLFLQARDADIKKIVYISALGACGQNSTEIKPLTEKNWNEKTKLPYFIAKTKAEKEAFRLAEEYKLWMVSLLPSAMIGPHAYSHLTPTLDFVHQILENRLPIDPQIYWNYVDVRDVAYGCLLAEDKGKNGERYILANEDVTSTPKLARILRDMYPYIEIPRRSIPKPLLKGLSIGMTAFSQLLRVPSPFPPTLLDAFYRKKIYCDNSKARKKLGWEPRLPESSIRDTGMWLKKHWEKGEYIGHKVRSKKTGRPSSALVMGTSIGLVSAVLAFFFGRHWLSKHQ